MSKMAPGATMPPGEQPTKAGDMAGMPGMSESEMLSTDATTDTANGYTLKLANAAMDAGVVQPLSFTIGDTSGLTVKQYQVEQTKELHMILVRADLTGYQHLHPVRDANGVWSISIDVANAGRWRMIADFTPIKDGSAGARIALGTDISVTGNGTNTELAKPAMTATTSDGYKVTVDRAGLTAGAVSKIGFTVTKDGEPVTELVPYLGAFGHLVVIRAETLAYLHVHPTVEATIETSKAGPTVEFNADIPKPGQHALFFQFATKDGLHTAAFTATV
jgi:hypothetical protein